MAIEIQDPKTGNYVPLVRAFNFEIKSMASVGERDIFSFKMDWTKEGSGQAILRDHIEYHTPLTVKYLKREYRGLVLFQTGENSSDGMIMVQEAPVANT